MSHNYKLQGAYLNDFIDGVLAGIVGSYNVLTLAPPGWGKSRVVVAVSQSLVPGRFNFTRFGRGKRDSIISGVLHPDTFKGGERKMNVLGTPMDPNNLLVLFDELGRANDPVLDAALDATDRIDLPADQRPVVLATANQFDLNDYTEAVADRFAAWIWLNPEMTDDMVENIVRAQMSGGMLELDLPCDLISWDEVLEIRNCMPTENSIQAVIQKCLAFKRASLNNGFRINPRRLDQWRRLLFYFSAYQYGTNDFTKVHPAALNLMRYAQPCATLEQHENWVDAIADEINAVETMIEKMLAEIVSKIKDMTSATSVAQSDSIIADLLSYQQVAIQDLRKVKQDAERTGDDISDEVGRAINTVLTIISAVAQGQDVDAVLAQMGSF